MDITRSVWIKSIAALASVSAVVELLTSAGIFGAGHYSLLNFTIYLLAAFGLYRLIYSALGMVAVAVLPAKYWVGKSRGAH